MFFLSEAPRGGCTAKAYLGASLGAVELVVDVTDNSGSQLGGVSGTVLKVPAQSNKEFQFSIKQKDAAFALIREIISR